MKFIRTTRLKIVEQIIIVFLFSVIVPMVISWLIINNINQHAVRQELKNSAIITATALKSSIEALSRSNITKLQEIALGLRYMPQKQDRYMYLNDIMLSNPNYKNIKIISPKDKEYATIKEDELHYDSETRIMRLTEKVYDGSYIIANINVSEFEDDLFNILKEDNRQAYIINDKNEVIFAHNYDKANFEEIIASLPKKMEEMKPILFGSIKNQPMVYYKLKQPNIAIIVDTTEAIMNETILQYRKHIFIAFLLTGFAILFIVGLYTSYLYVNIRQLIKGIIALSKGSYKRKIRLLTNLFTPHEVVFLASQFNDMGDEIYKSYKQLKQKNNELKRLDKFRSNLIDTVSHEFRTPLTSIKGYTSRLLRTDIEINEEMRMKSLKVIKRQVERLSAMVEDLLVVPDIEGSSLRIFKEEVEMPDIIESSMLSVSKYSQREFIVNCPETISSAYADKNRLEQVFLNVFENASKYCYENSPIIVDVEEEEFYITTTVTNHADYIPKEQLNKLFEKFTRVHQDTTTSISGTGLGLFIVKGLVDSMDGLVKLQSSKENLFTVTISIPKYKPSEVSV